MGLETGKDKEFGPFFQSVYHIDHNIQVNIHVEMMQEGRYMLEKVKGTSNETRVRGMCGGCERINQVDGVEIVVRKRHL